MTPPPIRRADIEAAAARIAPYIRRTPIVELATGELAEVPVACKLEYLQVTGTFKARGAFDLLTASEVPEAGVVAASGGNFALAIAHAADVLGHRATLFVPATSPAAKVDRLRGTGARVEVVEGYYPQAYEASRDFAAEAGALLAHAYDHPRVVEGAGTCGREFAEQVPDLDTVVVAVGGGGLVAGVASWFMGEVRVVPVETSGTATLHSAQVAGEPVEVEISGLAASSLGASRIGEHAWAVREHLAPTVVVTDDEVVTAQRRLWDLARVAAEPGGAAAVAALTSGRYRPDPDERVGVLVCGANLDPASLVG